MAETSQRKTLREVRDFLNTIDEQFLNRPFMVQQEETMHYIYGLDLADEDMYYDEDSPEDGCLPLKEWDGIVDSNGEHSVLQIGIPKGAPIITEDF